MIALLFYCFYLSISYTQPTHWELDVAPYRVHLQTDEVERLELLPGIGPIMAQKIAEFRIDHPIESPDDLTEIHGIGQKTVNQLRRLTTSKPNHED
jgi:DNA uptake protein ComE-like DNA-binding protein